MAHNTAIVAVCFTVNNTACTRFFTWFFLFPFKHWRIISLEDGEFQGVNLLAVASLVIPLDILTVLEWMGESALRLHILARGSLFVQLLGIIL